MKIARYSFIKRRRCRQFAMNHMLTIGTQCINMYKDKEIKWNQEKNEKLQRERDISFEDIAPYIEEDKTIDMAEHPNQKKYRHQKVFAVIFNNYVYLIPYVENEKELFLKTIIPNRKATKKYLGE